MTAATITGVSPANLDNYSPERYDARLQDDGTYTLVPVLWWDDASYADYQGDPYAEALNADANEAKGEAEEIAAHEAEEERRQAEHERWLATCDDLPF